MWIFGLLLCLLQVTRGEDNLPVDSEPTLTSESLTNGDIHNTGLFISTSYPPQTFELKDIVTSGPVVLVNKKTLFVPAFHYDGSHGDVHFWVGNGTRPDSFGKAILDEKNSSDSLRPYNGQNLCLYLPNEVTTDNVEYFGVWSVDEELSLGHVRLKGIEEVPEPRISSSQKFVMRVPKCCPIDSLITDKGCNNSSLIQFKPQFNVYEHNDTHFNNESLHLEAISFEPYIYSMQCVEGKYPLDESAEEFALLKNGSLLLKGATIVGIFSQQDFCMETIKGDDSVRIFICAPEHKIQQAMFLTYITLTFISTFCFAGTFFLYFFWLKIEDIHRKCFTAYVCTMTITFLSLIIVQLAYIEDGGCKVLGFLFQFSMIASFTLLAILCVDIYIIVKYLNKHALRRARQTTYTAVALAVPVLSLIISFSRNQVPDVPNSFFKPQYRKNSCSFPEEKQRGIFFYLPIIVSIAIGFVCLLLTKLKIVEYVKEKIVDETWFNEGTRFKFMCRKYLIITAVSSLWPLEIILQLYAPETGILIGLEIIEACQGIIILLLFVVNKEVWRLFLKRIKVRSYPKKNQNNIRSEDEHMMYSFNLPS